MSTPVSPGRVRLTFTHWLILTLASIGFAFDIYEILMAQLVVGPALKELAGLNPNHPDFTLWRSLLVWVPALAGGIFGLIGGYLTDRLGRRRVLTWSIMIYAVSALLASYSTSLTMLLILRSTTMIGVCVEFVAAVAWLAELFPDAHQRERVLGYTQAFSSIGGLLVAVANGIILDYKSGFFAIQIPDFLSGMLGDVADPHAAWRYTLMSGLLPAFPLLVIRPFLPESPVWQHKKDTGTLKRPNIFHLFAPDLRKTTIITTLMVACAYGAAFGAIQQIPEIVKGLTVVKEKREAAEDAAEKKAVAAGKTKPEIGAAKGEAGGLVNQKAASDYMKMQEIGGLIGRFLLALFVIRIVSRRNLLRTFQLPGLIIVPLIFWFMLSIDNVHLFYIPLKAIYVGDIPVTTVSLGVFLVGVFCVAQLSFWGNYLPRVYPTHLRGTGESFAANVGGRALGVGFWAVTTYLSDAAFIPGDSPPAKFASAAAFVALFVFAVGSLLCCILPEPKQDMLD